VNAGEVFVLFVASSAFVACGGEGPPRPNDVAPFPMPNARGIGLPNEQSYRVDEGSDLVLDEVTGLSWQRGTALGPGELGSFTRDDAALHCEALVQGRHDDFRLPTRLELVSIVDASSRNPAIDRTAFPEAPAVATWSASDFPADPERAFHVGFQLGDTNTSPIASEQLARCVRNERRPHLPTNDRFEMNPGTVTDRMTGLTWEREISVVQKVFPDAMSYCVNLAIDGTGGFRAPTVKELQTIVDDTESPVAVDPGVFPDTGAVQFWSSSLVAGDPASGWVVQFADGTSDAIALDVPTRVRCVR
jgi:hypothetical protein